MRTVRKTLSLTVDEDTYEEILLLLREGESIQNLLRSALDNELRMRGRMYIGDDEE